MNLSKSHKIGLIFSSILALGSVACGGSVQTRAPAAPVAESAMAETPVFAKVDGITVVEMAPAPHTTRHRQNFGPGAPTPVAGRNSGACAYEVRGASFDSRQAAEDFAREHRMNGAIVAESCDRLGEPYYSEFRDRYPLAAVTNFELGQ